MGLAILLNEIVCTSKAGPTQNVHSLQMHRHLNLAKEMEAYSRGHTPRTVYAAHAQMRAGCSLSASIQHEAVGHSVGGWVKSDSGACAYVTKLTHNVSRCV